MSPQNLGPFAALNPVAWQIEAIKLANRADARTPRHQDRPSPKDRRRGLRPATLLTTLAGLLALPWMF